MRPSITVRSVRPSVQRLIHTLHNLKDSPDLVYDQDCFGSVHRGVPMVCIASIVFVKEYGKEFFLSYMKNFKTPDHRAIGYVIEVACHNLGIPQFDFQVPMIFDTALNWPWDLSRAYYQATSNSDRLDVAIAALGRMDEIGMIETVPYGANPDLDSTDLTWIATMLRRNSIRPESFSQGVRQCMPEEQSLLA